jgi:hypothetical protein
MLEQVWSSTPSQVVFNEEGFLGESQHIRLCSLDGLFVDKTAHIGSFPLEKNYLVVFARNFEFTIKLMNISAPLIPYQLRKYFLSQPSPERIFLWHVWTLDAGYQTTLGSPVPGPIFSIRCWAAWDCDVTSTVDKCCLLQKYPVDYFLLSINRFHWLQAAVAWGLSTDQLIMLSGVQLLIFAVAYAVWDPYELYHKIIWAMRFSPPK